MSFVYAGEIRYFFHLSVCFFSLVKSVKELFASIFMFDQKKSSWYLDGLVCWVLWHINICRLLNAKSIFM